MGTEAIARPAIADNAPNKNNFLTRVENDGVSIEKSFSEPSRGRRYPKA